MENSANKPDEDGSEKSTPLRSIIREASGLLRIVAGQVIAFYLRDWIS